MLTRARLSTTVRSRRHSSVFRENVDGWLFASPWIIGFILFTAGPMLASLFLAFTEYDLLSSPRWVGLANFQTAFFDDPLVLHSLWITTIYAVVAIPLNIVIGFSLALLLNANIRGLAIYRTIFYLPAILSGVAVALLWRWLFNAEFGLVNYALSFIGITGPAWLGDPDWALSALIVMSLWNVGAGIVIYLAGLQGVPTELYEAAHIDGANLWQRIRSITIPMMTPVIFFQLIIGLVHALQVFTQAYIMTGGGPQDATRFFMLYLYEQGFQFYNMGYASALAWIIFLYTLVLTLLVLRSAKSWVHYEGGTPRR